MYALLYSAIVNLSRDLLMCGIICRKSKQNWSVNGRGPKVRESPLCVERSHPEAVQGTSEIDSKIADLKAANMQFKLVRKATRLAHVHQ